MAETQLPPAAGQQLATEVGAQNVITLIVFLALLLVAAYFVTKYVARRALTKGMKRKPSGSGIFRSVGHEPGTHVSVADRIAVDKDKTIMVVEFNGKYYLMSTTAHDIKCIDKVDAPVENQNENKEAGGAGEGDTASYTSSQEQYASESFGDYMKGIGRQFKGYFSRNKSKKGQADFDAQLKEKIVQQQAADEEADKEEGK